MNQEIELMKPMFNKKKLELPVLMRWNNRGDRYYFDIDYSNDEVTFYPSVTTLLGKVLPESEFLSGEKTKRGTEYWTWMNELADQGTFIHQEVTNYLINKVIDFDLLYDRVLTFIYGTKKNYDAYYWLRIVTPKIVSFLKFIKEWEVEPLFIETTFKYKDGNNKWAGTVDLLAYATVIDKKNTSRHLCLIDWKSGLNAYDSNAYQLQMYKMAIEQATGLVIEKLINVNPVKYLSGNTPNFKITNWSDNSNLQNLNHLLPLAMALGLEPTEVAIFSGKFTPDDYINSIYRMVDAKEHVTKLTKVINFKQKQGAA